MRFRGNLFTNTPDILPLHLQTGGRPMFQIRAVLAATLSSVYGIYSGSSCVRRGVAPCGREEYLDSEKYPTEGAERCARQHQGANLETKLHPARKPRAAFLRANPVPLPRNDRISYSK